MNKLVRQLWIGDHDRLPLQEDLFQPVGNNGGLKIKGSGGLWTSTWLGEEEGSEWIQWCLGESFNCPHNFVWKGYLLEPKDDLRVLTIDTVEDMHIMFDTYGYDYLPSISMEGIDFIKMSQDYDCMRLTSNGQVVTRHGYNFFGEPEQLKEEWKEKKMRNLYGWDAESTFHLKWNFTEVVPIQLKIKGE